MSDIVNLNRYRKRRAAKAKDAEAAENRIRFGRTKAAKKRDEENGAANRRRLDGHQIDNENE